MKSKPYRIKGIDRYRDGEQAYFDMGTLTARDQNGDIFIEATDETIKVEGGATKDEVIVMIASEIDAINMKLRNALALLALILKAKEGEDTKIH
jgi:hypothetical protein